MLLARFGSNFFFEGARLSASVGPAPVVGYCRGPALAAVSFFLRGSVLTASVEARSGSWILQCASYQQLLFGLFPRLDCFGRGSLR